MSVFCERRTLVSHAHRPGWSVPGSAGIETIMISGGLDTTDHHRLLDHRYNFNMPRVLYTAFDIVPSPKGASTHILLFIHGLVNSQFDVHLLTPNDGLLPIEDSIDGARVTRISQDHTQNFLARVTHFGRSVFTHLMLHPDYNVVHYRNIWDGLAIAQNKQRLGYKTLFEVNGLASIELK